MNCKQITKLYYCNDGQKFNIPVFIVVIKLMIAELIVVIVIFFFSLKD